jgi:hypothetical protein
MAGMLDRKSLKVNARAKKITAKQKLICWQIIIFTKYSHYALTSDAIHVPFMATEKRGLVDVPTRRGSPVECIDRWNAIFR